MKSQSNKGRRHQGGISRRVFLRRYVAAPTVATALGTTYCVAVEPTWLTVTRLRMPLRGLGPGLEGYRLVQISDLHCGSSVPMIYLWRCMDRVNELEPDLVVVTGDFNSRPDSVAYSIITDLEGSMDGEGGKGLRDAFNVSLDGHYGPLWTFHGFSGEGEDGNRIDYIFVSKNVRVMQLGILTDSSGGRYPSDHLPVIAEIRMMP